MQLQEIVDNYSAGKLTVDELCDEVSACVDGKREYVVRIEYSHGLSFTDSVMLTEDERVRLIHAMERAAGQKRLLAFQLHTHKPLSMAQVVAKF